MKNEVTDIHVERLATKTTWDDDKRKLSTTIQVTTNIPVETITDLMALQKEGNPLYITIGSDQAKFPLDEALAEASVGATDS